MDMFTEALDMAAFDAIEAIQAGDPDAAFVHARDAAHYAHAMMREEALSYWE